MRFPSHLDAEDMELFQKEAQLAGYRVYSVADGKGGEGVVVREGKKKFGYVRAAGGLWVSVATTSAWGDARKAADVYEQKLGEADGVS